MKCIDGAEPIHTTSPYHLPQPLNFSQTPRRKPIHCTNPWSDSDPSPTPSLARSLLVGYMQSRSSTTLLSLISSSEKGMLKLSEREREIASSNFIKKQSPPHTHTPRSESRYNHYSYSALPPFNSSFSTTKTNHNDHTRTAHKSGLCFAVCVVLLPG